MQALVKLNEQAYGATFQRFFNFRSQIIFLGTPHPRISHQEQWFRLGLILRAHPQISKLMRAQAEWESKLIADLCMEFEDTRLADTPVISIFESKVTKINEGFFRSRKELVGDVHAAVTFQNAAECGFSNS